MKIYIVWNKNKTEGYATTYEEIAYEARKGAESNCFNAEGKRMRLAQSFCELYSGEEDCTTNEVEL